MENVREAALTFEAIKIAMSQSKDGHILKLAIHPQDMPEDVFRQPVGTRYQVALVELSDENAPVIPKTVDEGNRAVKLAAMLCKDENFQNWIMNQDEIRYPTESTEDMAARWLREQLDITSRAELKTNAEARKAFEEIVDTFRGDIMQGHKFYQGVQS